MSTRQLTESDARKIVNHLTGDNNVAEVVFFCPMPIGFVMVSTSPGFDGELFVDSYKGSCRLTSRQVSSRDEALALAMEFVAEHNNMSN